jgi:hypothetical protein
MLADELVSMCEARITNLQQLRTSAQQLGDVARVAVLELEIADAERTLEALRNL